MHDEILNFEPAPGGKMVTASGKVGLTAMDSIVEHAHDRETLAVEAQGKTTYILPL